MRRKLHFVSGLGKIYTKSTPNPRKQTCRWNLVYCKSKFFLEQKWLCKHLYGNMNFYECIYIKVIRPSLTSVGQWILREFTQHYVPFLLLRLLLIILRGHRKYSLNIHLCNVFLWVKLTTSQITWVLSDDCLRAPKTTEMASIFSFYRIFFMK